MIQVGSGRQFSNLTRFKVTSSRSEDSESIGCYDNRNMQSSTVVLLGIANQVLVRHNFVLDT